MERLIGTIIEVPRAALRANEIVEEADFYSPSAPITQTNPEFLRNDASGKFLIHYFQDVILERNPFASIELTGSTI